MFEHANLNLPIYTILNTLYNKQIRLQSQFIKKVKIFQEFQGQTIDLCEEQTQK